MILKTADRDLVLCDLKLRKALTKQGFSTSSALITKTGSEYLDGERVFTLSHKIKSIPLPDVDRFGENHQEFVRKCCVSLANLHLLCHFIHTVDFRGLLRRFRQSRNETVGKNQP